MIQNKIANRFRTLNAVYYPQRALLAPKWLVLGVNNVCNLHCKMCDVGVNYSESNFFENLMGSKPTHMPEELLDRILDQSSKYFPHTKIGLAFTEPLIYKHLKVALEKIKSNNLYGSITTNGLGLAKWADVMAVNKLDCVNLSLDGPEDVHNFIRGNQHSYRLALEGVKELSSKSKLTEINVYCVITEWNIGRLLEFVSEMKKYSFAKIGLIHPNFTSDALAEKHNNQFGMLFPATSSNTSDANYDNIDLQLLWTEMHELINQKSNVSFFPDLPSKQSVYDYYQKPEKFIGKRCMDVFSSMMIKSNGECIPAHGRCYNHKVGNIYNEELTDIWNSASYSSFRKVLSDAGGLLPACSRCCGGFGA
jgi:Fe-coproporphyrin III synthase